MDETVFLLIRHAESLWNAEGRWQGRGDPPLSERGRAQAARLGREVAGERPDLLIASDLSRAAETASALGAVFGLAPRKDPRLRELDVGTWTGLTREEIERREGELLERFERGDPDARPGGGESRREIRLRVRRTLAEIADRHRGRTVAIVTHLGVIRALLPGSEFANAEWRRVRARELVPPESTCGGDVL